MLHLLKVEWLKIKNYRTFWILIILITISIPAFCYIVYDITDNTFPKVEGKSILGSPFGFPDVWPMVTFFASLVLFIPAVLVITLITNEFNYKTHRQNVIDGWSRTQFICVKLMEVFILSLYLTLIVFAAALTFGLNVKSAVANVSMWDDSRFILFFFIQALSYLMVALVISLLIKRAGLAMGIFFLYSIILEQIVVQLARHFLDDAGRFLPLEVADRLIPQPFIRTFSGERADEWRNNLPYFIILSIVYLLLYTFFSHRKFSRSDL